jgi:hypothetical protein
MAGIGCHFMALWMDRETTTFTNMGCEGAPWIGQAPFTEEDHVFVNLGDGTYSHSGSLAIRAAVTGQVNVTYKLLYNDAVAMTGGQSTESGQTTPQIAKQLLGEGVKKVVIVADEPTRYANVVLPEMNLGQLALLLRGKYLVDVQSVTKVAGMAFRADEIEGVIDAALDGTLGDIESDKAKFARLTAATVGVEANAEAGASA